MNAQMLKEATEALRQELDAPAFFARLAEHNVRPTNDNQAEKLYKMGQACYQQYVAEEQAKLQKSAAASGSLIDRAFARICGDDSYASSSLGVNDDVADDFAKRAFEANPVLLDAAAIYQHARLSA